MPAGWQPEWSCSSVSGKLKVNQFIHTWSWWACRVAAAAADSGSGLFLWRVASAEDRSSRIFL